VRVLTQICQQEIKTPQFSVIAMGPKFQAAPDSMPKFWNKFRKEDPAINPLYRRDYNQSKVNFMACFLL
jgi:hypothetical protein